MPATTYAYGETPIEEIRDAWGQMEPSGIVWRIGPFDMDADSLVAVLDSLKHAQDTYTAAGGSTGFDADSGEYRRQLRTDLLAELGLREQP